MTPKTLTNVAAEADRLRAAAEEAAVRAAEAERAAAEAAQLAEDRRQAEILAIRRRRLDEYDPDALAAEVRAAQARFRDAVLADDGAVSAFIAWQVLASRRYLLAVEARQAQACSSPTPRRCPSVGRLGPTCDGVNGSSTTRWPTAPTICATTSRPSSTGRADAWRGREPHQPDRSYSRPGWREGG